MWKTFSYELRVNKPDRATMRPGCVSACIDHVTYVWERQMDEQTGEKTLKTCWLIICFSVGSHRGQKQPRNAVFAQALRTDGPTDGHTDRRTDRRTDRPSYRDMLLTDASTLFLLSKDKVYKDIEAEILPKIKDILRTNPSLRFGEICFF